MHQAVIATIAVQVLGLEKISFVTTYKPYRTNEYRFTLLFPFIFCCGSIESATLPRGEITKAWLYLNTVTGGTWNKNWNILHGITMVAINNNSSHYDSTLKHFATIDRKFNGTCMQEINLRLFRLRCLLPQTTFKQQ